MEVKLCFLLLFISRRCQFVDHVGASNGKKVELSVGKDLERGRHCLHRIIPIRIE
jgi:hypothetical protein